ncbi:MAG TPA: carbon-nitrogen hydrolase family protein [Candidatus Saccharimonadales bacterium]|nr:carbon-nitrogen hydrolase family protein [Candidatus Saccharimonadales bacterium]
METRAGEVRVAIIQQPPVLLDRVATLAAAVTYLHDAAAGGAKIAVFPETFIPGYPAWIWRLRPGGDYELTGQIHQQLVENSVDLATDDLRPLRDAAAETGMVVVCGLHERDGAFGRSTLYNTAVTIGADGTIQNRHRKLVPTNPERMVWGQGDATGLRVIPTEVGRIGTLICWENYMPLARYALYAEGVEVYVASTWDDGDTWIATMKHIAAEGRCWVLGSGCALRAADVPDTFPGRADVFPDPDEWINPGDSIVVAPGGDIVAGPMHAEQGILFADIEPARAAAERRTLDVTGHYSRPDIFQLQVDRGSRDPVTYR